MNPENPKLNPEQVKEMIKLISLTCDHELNCAQCLENVSEYAERQLSGQPLEDAVAKVEQHLAVCPECREEYLALIKILKSGI